jgi:hypothetical protein
MMKASKLQRKTTDQLVQGADTRFTSVMATIFLVVWTVMACGSWRAVAEHHKASDVIAAGFFTFAVVLMGSLFYGVTAESHAMAKELANRHDPEYETFRLQILEREDAAARPAAAATGTPVITDKPAASSGA